ncbi:ABC transporter ATP-binding protein [Clostridium estertheticum]|uniref:ABC transporter ATP-binding protein n=1 Tax=Clostridium estertheticum TaxID=238834 RepID=UPI001CF51765|nr:ABC transporter ATP-binding protein [Clostridium estertheticum]MCB2306993.1 ABC transporter ATP-binding protein [Clostridium estertheticum]MCB2345801.1 ABC transporter ATP-binding protein [Clostridium estertheticum]MCB2350607.1 ABC transporter ATP-binding protein [Clostridium estertheticum]WAG45512.1 ABC transporter ATP-binding protein [Clostridium estertheticum]
MDYILRTINLSKKFIDNEVVTNVNMNIKKGEIYGFLGPNGAGKTTIMKMILNLVKPSIGEIEIFGEKLNFKAYEILKRIGSIIEYPVFYDKLTGRENLELHCEYMGYYNKSAVNRALELVNLSGIDDKPVENFSLGMKQRLGIARAIITKPEFLILDEPINGLDPIGIKQIRNLLKMLSKEYGITILISSHILSEIEQIADTIGIITNGILIKEVSMESIRTDHTEYVEINTKDFIKASYILENDLNISNFKIVDNTFIRIYDLKLAQKDISKALILKGIEIESINKKKSSLEDYFLKLLNGGNINA